MKVIDCRSEAAFSVECRKLAELIKKKGVEYDLVIGVATGGKDVADKIVEYLGYSGEYAIVKRQRLSTQAKNKTPFLRQIIQALPTWINDKLRALEVTVAEWKFERSRHKSFPRCEVRSISNGEAILKGDHQNILIIDDTIDSGRTLLDVEHYVRQHNEKGKVEFAALTTTHRRPLLVSDYLLYERCILKFPWSLDG